MSQPTDRLKTTRTVGRNVRAARSLRQLTQADLHARLEPLGWKVSVAHLSKVEKGMHPITVDQLAVLADALGLAAEDLLAERTCSTCLDQPPAGFTCNSCGVGAR